MNTESHALAPHRPIASAVLSSAVLLARQGVSFIRQRLARPPGADELRGMSEQDLRDLGIGRSEVGRVLDGRS